MSKKTQSADTSSHLTFRPRRALGSRSLGSKSGRSGFGLIALLLGLTGCSTSRPTVASAPTTVSAAPEVAAPGRPDETASPVVDPTDRRPSGSERVPEPAPAPVTRSSSQTRPAPVIQREDSVRPTVSRPRVPEGEYGVLVETEPAGAIIVVNGIPVGRSPRRVLLPGTPQGFSRVPVNIKARFLATTTAEESRTVELDFTPLDKLPGRLVFTPNGVSRRSPN